MKTSKAAPPTELELLKQSLTSLETKVAEQEARLTALMILGNPQTYKGHAIPRCQCKRLATRSATIRTRFDGTHTQILCDECKASGPLVFDSVISYAEIPDGDELNHIRCLNKALGPSLPNPRAS